MEKGDKVLLVGSGNDKEWFFVRYLADGSVALSDNENELVFGSKFVDPIWIKS